MREPTAADMPTAYRDPGPTITTDSTLQPSPEAVELAKLRARAVIVRDYLPNISVHDRLARLEAMMDVLVEALHIKGTLELEEVRRELSELGHASRNAVKSG